MGWHNSSDEVIFDKENKQIDGKYTAITLDGEQAIGYLVVDKALGFKDSNKYYLFFNTYIRYGTMGCEKCLDSVLVHKDTIKKYTQIEKIKNLLKRGKKVKLIKQCHEDGEDDPEDNLIATIEFIYEIPYELWGLKEDVNECFIEKDIKPFDTVHFADSDGRELVNSYENDKWRSIKMPPDSSRTVLIQLSFGNIITGYYMDNEWWAYNFGSKNKKIDKDFIVCWNDLPKLYKGDEL